MPASESIASDRNPKPLVTLTVTTFLEETASALTGAMPLRDALQICAQNMVNYLGAAAARIWILSDDNDRLDLCASAGIPPIFPSVRTAELWICRTLSEGRPHLSNDIASDPLFGNREWALTEGLVGYAGHPMISRGRPIGVISLFSRQPLAGDVLGALSLASGSIALLVERSHAETRLDTAIEEAQSRPPLLPAEFSSALRRPTPGCAERIQVRATAGLEDLIPGYLASQKRGIEALAQAVDRGDFPTARKIGHGMKGSGASYGFPAITDSGSHIEQCAIARDAPGIARHIADMSDFLSRLEVIY